MDTHFLMLITSPTFVDMLQTMTMTYKLPDYKIADDVGQRKNESVVVRNNTWHSVAIVR